MLKIGIAGGIGAGKSFVSQIFVSWGARVIDADQWGHRVLELPAVRAALIAEWGPGILTNEGLIARSELAKLVFGTDAASRQRLEFLESHSHPEITRAVERELASAEASGVVAAILDAAVMFKAGWDLWCDHLIFVDCRSEIRWERVRTRGWTFEQFTAREALQLPLEEKRRRADAVIVNEPDFPRSVDEQAKELWTRWGLPLPPAPPPAMGESRSTNSSGF